MAAFYFPSRLPYGGVVLILLQVSTCSWLFPLLNCLLFLFLFQLVPSSFQRHSMIPFLFFHGCYSPHPAGQQVPSSRSLQCSRICWRLTSLFLPSSGLATPHLWPGLFRLPGHCAFLSASFKTSLVLVDSPHLSVICWAPAHLDNLILKATS